MLQNLSAKDKNKVFISSDNKYKVEIHSIVENNGQRFYAAVILKAVRSFWDPIYQGLYLTEKELEPYLY
jgi:hypothetical protein